MANGSGQSRSSTDPVEEEEAERLSERFRASWEVAPGTVSPNEPAAATGEPELERPLLEDTEPATLRRPSAPRPMPVLGTETKRQPKQQTLLGIQPPTAPRPAAGTPAREPAATSPASPSPPAAKVPSSPNAAPAPSPAKAGVTVAAATPGRAVVKPRPGVGTGGSGGTLLGVAPPAPAPTGPPAPLPVPGKRNKEFDDIGEWEAAAAGAQPAAAEISSPAAESSPRDKDTPVDAPRALREEAEEPPVDSEAKTNPMPAAAPAPPPAPPPIPARAARVSTNPLGSSPASSPPEHVPPTAVVKPYQPRDAPDAPAVVVDAAVAADSEAVARAARATAQARLAETRSRGMPTLPGDVQSPYAIDGDLERVAFRKKSGVWWTGAIALGIIGATVYLAMNHGSLIGGPAGDASAEPVAAEPALAKAALVPIVSASAAETSSPLPPASAAEPSAPEPSASASSAVAENAPERSKPRSRKSRPQRNPDRTSARVPRPEAKPKAKPGGIVRDSPF